MLLAGHAEGRPGVRRVRFLGGDAVALEDVAEPVAGDGQALVRIEMSALCGSERAP